MNLRGFFVAILSLALCVYVLNRSLSGFRQTRKYGTVKPYFYGLGMAVAIGVIAVVLLAALLLFIGPLH
jgi:hypothetical protein